MDNKQEKADAIAGNLPLQHAAEEKDHGSWKLQLVPRH